MTPRVLVLVLSADGEYDKLTQAIRRTWGSDARDDFQVFYHYGWRATGPRPGTGDTIREGDVLVSGIDDSWFACLPKRLMAFNYVRRNCAFDYVYACCSGSYLDRDALLAWVDDKPRERFYAGVNGPYLGSSWRYASGSGFFLSCDLVNLVADHAAQILAMEPQHYNFDDVTFGQFLDAHGVTPQDAPRINDEIRAEPGNYHWHFRVEPEKFDAIRALLRGAA